MKTTITEALSEINLIKKKIESAQQTVLSVLNKPKHLDDAFKSDGGSPKLIERQVQSMNDNFSRLEKIRSAVSQANLDTSITVGETTKTIFDWLTWKREVAESHLTFAKNVYTQAKVELDRVARVPQVYKDEEGKTHLLEIESNVDLGTWLKKQEVLTETLEKLDGQLSLKNATVLVDI